jgi:hypothetical protein
MLRLGTQQQQQQRSARRMLLQERHIDLFHCCGSDMDAESGGGRR